MGNKVIVIRETVDRSTRSTPRSRPAIGGGSQDMGPVVGGIGCLVIVAVLALVGWLTIDASDVTEALELLGAALLLIAGVIVIAVVGFFVLALVAGVVIGVFQAIFGG